MRPSLTFGSDRFSGVRSGGTSRHADSLVGLVGVTEGTPSRIGQILVVEDDVAAALLAQDTLQSVGHAVTVVGSAEQGALFLDGTDDVALIVLDIMLPGMNGFEFCKTLKAFPKTSSIPVLMLTAKAGRDDYYEGLMLSHATAYLRKPTDPMKFLNTVEKLLKLTLI